MKSLKIINPKPHQEVKKRNELIDARYELSELALKLLSSVISMVHREDELFQTYVIKVSDFKELTGLTGRSIYENIEHALNELMKEPITIRSGKDRFLKFMWFASAEYIGYNGTIEIELSQKIRPYFIDLKGDYLSYEIKNILSLKSNYVIRLYELLKHEYNKVNNYTNNKVVALDDIDIVDLREMFSIPDSYEFKDIRVNIIDKAKKQLEEKTDIKFEVEYIKLGRAVKWLRFTVRDNNPELHDYMKDRKSFIKYIRTNFINRVLFEDLSKNLTLAISPKGRLYNQRNNLEYDKNKADIAWNNLYKLAQNNKLTILKNI